MLTVRDEVNGVPEGMLSICSVFVKPVGAETTRPRTDKLAKAVAESIVTVFEPVLEMTMKSKLVEGNCPADQLVVSLQTELTAFVQRFVVTAEAESVARPSAANKRRPQRTAGGQ